MYVKEYFANNVATVSSVVMALGRGCLTKDWIGVILPEKDILPKSTCLDIVHTTIYFVFVCINFNFK